jgi:UDP-glucose 4-epimerase
MHFIVTGGAGFIGSYVTEQLLDEQHLVTVVDNLSTGILQNLPTNCRLTFIQKNLLECQAKDFDRAIDCIVHLAATPSVSDSWTQPLEVHHNNLSTTVAVIQLCQELKIPKLVLISSAAVYGNLTQVPISESSATHPISPYGLQKLFSEQYASIFAQKIGFSLVILRVFNVFGPRQNPISSYSGVVSIFFNAMQKGLPVDIYGNGEQSRDFICVKDVANAVAKALIIPLNPGQSITCNIGTGISTSLVQLLDILKTYFPDWKSEIRCTPSRIGEIQHSQADISKAASALGFSPMWSINSGIDLLIGY